MAKKTNHIVDGRHYCKVTATVGFEEDGSRIRKFFYGKSKKEALSKRDTYMDGLNRGLTIDYDRVTFAECFKEWLYVVKRPTLAANSFSRYECTARNHISDAPFSNVPVVKIRSLDVQKFYNKINDAHGANQVDRVHLLVNGFFVYCQRECIIDRNPATNVVRPKIKRDTTKKEFLSKADIKIMTEAFRTVADRFVFLLALNTGMRPGEILALTHGDIDLDNQTIRVNKSIKRVMVVHDDGTRNVELITSPPKTQSGNRVLPLADLLIAPMQRHMSAEKAKHLLVGIPFSGTSYLFSCAGCTTPLRNDHLTVRLRKLQKEYSVEPVDFKGLRHTFCSLLADMNTPLKTAMVMMGHSDPKQILKIYAHVYKDSEIAAIKGLSEYQ